MTTTGDPVAATGAARVRLDRPLLASNLVSGALWLSPLALSVAFGLFFSWALLLIGVLYVVVGSVFLAAVYANQTLTRQREVLAWIAPWLVAVGLWTAIVVGVSFEDTVSHYLFSLYAGLLIATPCYLAWQIVALAVRQLMAWRPGRSTLPA